MAAQTIRDQLWLWGMKVNVLRQSGYPQLPPSTMTAEDAIRRTGIRNVLMAGGLPLTRPTLDAMPSARRIIAKWSLHAHAPERGAYLDPEGCLAALRHAKQLAGKDPRIDAFLIDDFSTGTIAAGVKPEHLAHLQYVNACEFPHLPLMGTVYEMSLEDPRLWGCLPYFASCLSPLWHAAQIDQLPGYLARIAELTGGKPQLVCLYLYDFGNDRPLTWDLMQRQLEMGERLLREKRVTGVCLLGTCLMDLDWDANRCLYQWLDQVGDSPL